MSGIVSSDQQTKYIQFIIIYDKEKHETLTLENWRKDENDLNDQSID